MAGNTAVAGDAGALGQSGGAVNANANGGSANDAGSANAGSATGGTVTEAAGAGVGGAGAAGEPSVGMAGARSTHELGMNDVSFLLPLPTDLANPVILAPEDSGLIPDALYTRLATAHGDIVSGLDRFQLVAIRWDLCDRVEPGECAPALDGRLRLVFQSLEAGTVVSADDFTLHAFYAIPHAELALVVGELRALAELGSVATSSPLSVNRAVTTIPAYVLALKTLVLRYALPANLTRLTLFAQDQHKAAVVWVMRGVEASAGTFVDMAIPGIHATQQGVTFAGDDLGFRVDPVTDFPVGVATMLDGIAFQSAAPEDKTRAFAALAEAQNPMLNTPQTEQCIDCHVATYLSEHRAAATSTDLTSTDGRFTSNYDLSIKAGIAATSPRSLRAFGWLGGSPAISQRVANETAQVLSEIERRFPAR